VNKAITIISAVAAIVSIIVGISTLVESEPEAGPAGLKTLVIDFSLSNGSKDCTIKAEVNILPKKSKPFVLQHSDDEKYWEDIVPLSTNKEGKAQGEFSVKGMGSDEYFQVLFPGDGEYEKQVDFLSKTSLPDC